MDQQACHKDTEPSVMAPDSSLGPDTSSGTTPVRMRAAQVPKSLPVNKLYPPLEYPPEDTDTEQTPPPSPPTCIDTPPLRRRSTIEQPDVVPDTPATRTGGVIHLPCRSLPMSTAAGPLHARSSPTGP